MNNENTMKSENYIPTVFISYSWASDEHQIEIIKFATDLMENGQMNVILDVWDARPGDDLNYFMEKNVKSEKTDFVLVILDETYKIKADNRKGGVGTESVILSEEVYNHVEGSKVLPIIWELDEDEEPFVPNFLSARKYFDFVNDYDGGFESLIRTIHNLPEYPKPKIGKLSDKIKKQKLLHPNLNKYSKINLTMELSQKSIDVLVEDFLDDYLINLKELNISSSSSQGNVEFYEEIIKNINNYIPLRDLFINFFENIIRSKSIVDLEVHIVKEFFIELYAFTQPSREGIMGYQHFIIYDFILRELFLYLVTIGLKNRNYLFLTKLLNYPYYFEVNSRGRGGSQNFMELDNRGELYTNDEVNKYFLLVENKSTYNGLGYLLISRLYENYNQDDFVDADLLCCYLSYLNFIDGGYFHDWFPYTYEFKQSSNYMLFRMLSSKSHFLKIKELLDINSVEELKRKIDKVDSKIGTNYGFRQSFPRYVKPISEYINPEDICTEK